jgi:hypothetical protein
MYNTDQILLEKQYTSIVENKYGVGGRSITKAQLVDIIKDAEAAHKGTNFFSVTQVTRENTKVAPTPVFVLPGLKTNNGKTYYAKVSQVNGQIGYDYANAVNKQREREGKAADFVAKASNYQEVENSTALQRKGEQLYVRYRPIQSATDFKPVYVKATADAPTGPNQFAIVDKAEVQQYKASRPDTGAYQGIDTGIEARTLSLDSIAAITIGRQSYTISDLDPVRSAIYQAANRPAPQNTQVV